jgi:hypothetical protein
MVVYKNDLGSCIKRVAEYLKFGAGVKVQLEFFKKRKESDCSWYYYVPDNHPDYTKAKDTISLSDFNSYKQVKTYENNFEIIKVKDSMESIEDSWIAFILAAENDKTIILDLSDIRPAGLNLKTGVISTGLFGINEEEEGFVSVYYWIAHHLRDGNIGTLLRLLGGLCKVVARGGTHKNGIITTAIRWDSPYAKEYLDFPLASILGSSKKGIRLTKDVLLYPELCELIVEKVNKESLFLEKVEKVEEGHPELYHNVCIGLLIEDKGSCLTSPTNAGQCKTPFELIEALSDMTKLLCLIHTKWRKDVSADPSMYLPLDKDRQVGVTWVGWANFLRQQDVTYADHVWGLKNFRLFLENIKGDALLESKSYLELLLELRSNFSYSKNKLRALDIAACLWQAYKQAAVIGAEFGLERVFGIEPTQRCYKDFVDLDGFTTCRNIDPPFGRHQQRNSSVHGDELFYHGEVQTVAQVGQDVHQDHCEEWQRIMNSTGLSHGISFDNYRKIDIVWLVDFIKDSPLKGTYYMQEHKVDQSYLDKGTVAIACDLIEDDGLPCNCG